MASVVAAPLPGRTSRFALMAAIVFAALASALVFVAVQEGTGGERAAPFAGVEVVVAARDVPANTVLTADMLEVVSLPEDAIVDGAYATAALLPGMAVRFPVAKGEQITPVKVGLATVDDGRDLALVVSQGRRAFAVEVSEVTGVGGLLLPGNSVDVIAVFSETTAGADKAVTLLQNVVVLAVAQEAQEPLAPAVEPDATLDGGVIARRPDGAERQPDARTVTLAVTLEQAQLLALAQEHGRLWLALRPGGDDENLTPDETSLQPYRSP